MSVTEQKTTTAGGDSSPRGAVEQRQRRQMLIALCILLTALIIVLVKDRQFWFPSPPATAEDAATDANQNPTAASDVPAKAEQESPAPASVPAPASAKKKSHPEPHAQHAVPAAAVTAPTPAPTATISASNRAALPPLEVEVVAGDERRTIEPANRSVRVDLQPPASVPVPAASAGSSDNSGVATNAGERVRLSPVTAHAVEHPVEPSYPMLAKQMKVQGSVVLQALIGREGSIQDLRVLSGPAILSNAAMDAVRQWRFRPYLQLGQPVETEARITVNFTISTY
jgi:TonB family protein